MPPISRRPLLAALGALTVLGLGAGLPAKASAAHALVAVAANFADAARAIAAEYEKESGNSVTITVGSTGTLQSQILKGAPYDAMLSADARTPEELEGVGLVVRDSRFTYAIGKLALWYPAGTAIKDPAALLKSPEIAHIAIANPKLAPYGAAARETIGALGLEDRLDAKIVMGQNIGQTFAMVHSGAAPLGFVALSSLKGPKAPKRGAIWVVPQEDYGQIRQDAGLLKHGADNPAAKGFLAYLKGAGAQKVKALYGYGSA